MSVEPFKLSKKICIREVRIQNTNLVEFVQGGHKIVACIPNRTEMSGSDETCDTDQSKVFHGRSKNVT
jgi:hypothetical protein